MRRLAPVIAIAVLACGHQTPPRKVARIARTPEVPRTQDPVRSTSAPLPSSTPGDKPSAPVRKAQAASVGPAREGAGTVQDMIIEIFGSAAPKALRVFQCESRYDPHARNGSHYGVAQLSKRYHEARARKLGFTWAQMYEPRPNLLVARDLYREQGWRPWSCA